MPAYTSNIGLPKSLRLISAKGNQIPALTTQPEKTCTWLKALSEAIASFGDEFNAVLNRTFPTTVENVPAVLADPENGTPASEARLGSAALEAQGLLIIRSKVAELYVNPDEVSTRHAPDANGDQRTTKSRQLSPAKLEQMLFAIERKLFGLVFGQRAVGTVVNHAVRSIVLEFDPDRRESRVANPSISQSRVFTNALALVRARIDQTCVNNRTRLSAKLAKLEMRHGTTIDTALAEFTELHDEKEHAGDPAEEKQRIHDLENKLLPGWCSEVDSFTLAFKQSNAGAAPTSPQIWSHLIEKQSKLMEKGVPPSAHPQNVGRGLTGGGERSLLASGHAGHHTGGCSAAAQRSSPWATAFGALLRGYAMSQESGLLKRWFSNRDREDSECFVPDCGCKGFPVFLCPGHHNAPITSLEGIKRRLAEKGRDPAGDLVRRQRRPDRGSSERSGPQRDHKRGNGRRRDTRGQRPNNRRPEGGDRRRDNRRWGQGGDDNRRGRGHQRANTATHHDSRGDLSFDDPGFPPQQQHAFSATRVVSPTTVLTSDDDVLVKRRLPRKPKKDIKVIPSGNSKVIIRVRRRKLPHKKAPKRKTPSAGKAEMKTALCACGYEAPSTVHKLWKQHKVTCPVSTAKGAKNIPLLRMAKSKDRKRRRKNAQQRIRQAKASLRELAAATTDDELTASDKDGEPRKLSSSSSNSSSSVASAPDSVGQEVPKPALPPTTGGKGMWGFPHPPGSPEYIAHQRKLMRGYERKKASPLPERSSSSSSSDGSSSEDTEERNVRNMQRAILQEAPDVVPLDMDAASAGVASDAGDSSSNDDTPMNSLHFRGQQQIHVRPHFCVLVDFLGALTMNMARQQNHAGAPHPTNRLTQASCIA